MAVSRRRLITAAALAPVLGACDQAAAPLSFKAVDITGADYAQDLDLPDTEGKRRHISEFKGKLTVVFFGFTQCPDVCPTTMLELAQVKQALGADGAKVQGVFVSIDPERDTPEVLKAYVQNFSPDFIALRGTPEETKAMAKRFKVFYAKVPGKTEGGYTLDHTAGSYIFDAQGKVRLFTRYGAGAEALKHDLQILLKQTA
ncbi:SCO family protein [Rubrivivax rivuli]|uniref:SCO family protein n=1 Tax=Rubrivivax rivuli TaxID=1862385 RepID=A0A437RLL8_9BURK|nr:SCO family protein [Rubrivivax rivuli]RVU47690.1 SCO family protein [Rubrivivax rivuli]